MLRTAKAALAGPGGRARTDDHRAVRVWLRLLSRGLRIEGEVGKRLRTRFGTSLARFDVPAQPSLHKQLGRLRIHLAARTAGVPAARRKGAR